MYGLSLRLGKIACSFYFNLSFCSCQLVGLFFLHLMVRYSSEKKK